MAKQDKNQDTQERRRKPSRPRQSNTGTGRSTGNEPGSTQEREERNPGSEGGERGHTGTPRRTQDE